MNNGIRPSVPISAATLSKCILAFVLENTHIKYRASLVTQSVKNPCTMQETACNVGDLVQSLGQKIPWRSKWQPTPVFLLENPMDRGVCALQSMGLQS